eukprot:3892484-Amphidinium_carterae.1
MVGKLIRCLYGTRDAAQAWEEFYTNSLKNGGYIAGKASPCVFRAERADSSGVVHGDDFVFEGEEPCLLALEAELKKTMLIKRKALLGPEEGDDKHVAILNRL